MSRIRKLIDIIPNMHINPLKIIIRQSPEWKESLLSNKDFFKKYQPVIKNLRIGCSFSPEHLEWIYYEEKKEFNEKKGLDILSFIINNLGIKDIRLGIRWNKSLNTKNQVDLAYYKKYLDILFENNINICLNIGPIKTFRWPEQHVPDFLFENTKKPKKGEVVKSDSYLAEKAYGFARNLFKELQKIYSKEQLDKIKIVQLENEPFIKFGEYEWLMDEEYLKNLSKLTLAYLPHVTFLVNSSEHKNLLQISKFYKSLTKDDPLLKNRLIIGVNYFYKTPFSRKLPLAGIVDSISFKNDLFAKNIESAKKVGYKIEITEGQAEPWPPSLTPGNSASEFRFMILRCANHILDIEKPSIIRVWGIENLTVKAFEQRLDMQHKEILGIIKIINNQ